MMSRRTTIWSAWLVLAALTLMSGATASAMGRKPAPKAEPGVQATTDGLPTRPEQIPERELPAFTPPKPLYTELPNGIRLFVLEDHELPLINVAFRILNGSRCDAPEKLGVMGYTAGAIRRGGSVRVQGDALDDTLDYLAASISMSMDVEAASGNLNVLKKDFDVGLSLLADIIVHPAFPQDKIDEIKRIDKEGIRRREDDPGEIARMKFRHVVYGKENPWARELQVEHVDRITRDDLIECHGTWFLPNITYVAVSGDISRDEAVEKISRAFAEWERRPVPEIVLTEPGRGMPPGVYIYPKDVEQSVVRMGGVGMARHSEDQYAVEVMNRIFGVGTFTSRLGLEVRSNRGLAYSVFGAVFSDPDPRQGMLLALAGTRADRTHEAATVMRAVIDSMSTKPITDAEMKQVKDMIINSFIFQYDSPHQIVGQQMLLASQGYPGDYLETYIERIQAVGKDDVLRVAEKYLDPDALRYVVVGDSTKFDRPLSDLGPVTELEPYHTGEAEVQEASP